MFKFLQKQGIRLKITTNPINYFVLSSNAKVELRSFDDKLKINLRIWDAFLRETTLLCGIFYPFSR